MTTSMEFWGVEVKSGSPVEVTPDDDAVIHLSQASLGEVKKDKRSESINLYVNIGGKTLVIGILSGEKFPQIPFDLVFERRFELSHDWKNGSVYFCGYQSFLPMSGNESDSSDFEEYPVYKELPLVSGNSVKPESEAKPVVEKAKASESDSVVAKQKAKIVEPVKEDDSSSDEESEENDSDAEDQVMASGGRDIDDEDKSSDSEESEDDSGSEEEPPKKVEQSKKRPIKSATKTPAPEKKAKFVTPQKTDAKKGAVHVATPHPSKHASKAAASNEQAKQQTSSSSLPVSCKTCNRSFKSDQALQAHSKAKHGFMPDF